MFSVRIVSTDHYMSPPIRGLDVQYADQRGAEVKKVPVVRIYGSTPAGQKTCMHVHGVFPYLYVPYDGTVPWDRYLRQFATSLDKAINVAQGHGQSNAQHVYKVVLVTGRSMYGYHDKEQQFLKIYFYNPKMIRKAADLLLGGAVLNKPFQPHEAHIPYTLQLFIDYNLYGMNMINVAAVKFRRDSKNGEPDEKRASQSSDEGSAGRTPTTPFTALLNRSGSMTPSQRVWQRENIPSELYLDGSVERQSTCELEVDVVAADIINRMEVGTNIGTNPGLSALWEDERQRHREQGDTADIAPPESPDRGDVDAADSEIHLRERLYQILEDLQPYMDSQSDTESEEASQDVDFPLTQASSVELHLSQVDAGGSQGMETEEEEEKPVVDVQSIQRVVSFSQSFSDVRPELLKISSQDKPLVDILASLADDSSPQNSQHAAAELVAMEEQDSILSQLTPTADDKEEEKEEVEEILEMSQQIWETDENKPIQEEYDLAGLDDTWADSTIQPKSPATAGMSADDDDSDSDTSDIIPQYDGPPDEKGDSKQEVLKRLGMRGPRISVSSSRGMPVPSFDSRQNIIADNPFADSPSNNQPFSSYPGSHPHRFPGSWNHPGNQNWSPQINPQNTMHRFPPGSLQQSAYQNSHQTPSVGNQYRPRGNPSPCANQAIRPPFPMPSGNQAMQHQYPRSSNLITQQLSPVQGHIQGNQQLSPPQAFVQGNQQLQSHHGHVQGSQGSQLVSPLPGQTQGKQQLSTHFAGIHCSQQLSPHHSNQQLSPPQGHLQGQLSPGTFASLQSPPSSQQMSPQYIAQPLQHAQSSQPDVPYSSPSFQSQVNITRFSQDNKERLSLGQANRQSDIVNKGPGLPESSGFRGYQGVGERQEFHPAFSRDMDHVPLMHSPKAGRDQRSQLSSAPQSRSFQKLGPNARSNSVQQNEDLNVPMFTAQPSNSVSSSQQQAVSFEVNSLESGRVPKGNPSAASNSFMSSLMERTKAKLNNNQDAGNSSQVLSLNRSVTSPPERGDMARFISDAFMQHHENLENTGGLNLSQQLIRRHHSLEGLHRPDLRDNSPRSSSLQHSPRTPASDSGLQSPESGSSKVSEPFVGPITKYYAQKRLLYEQISPPTTPVSTSVSDFIKKPAPATSTASIKAPEPEISPLHKLLLDSSELPQQSQQANCQNVSKNSMSSPGCDKANLSEQDLFLPVSKNVSQKSRLYNLLAQNSKGITEKKERADLSQNSQQSLNDSQQDLFADSLLSETGRTEDTANDSLSSLFSEENVGIPRSQPHSSTPNREEFSLSNLETFVGSVRNESAEFGVNFSKTSTGVSRSDQEITPTKSIPVPRNSAGVTRIGGNQTAVSGTDTQNRADEVLFSQKQFFGEGIDFGQPSGRGMPLRTGADRGLHAPQSSSRVVASQHSSGSYNISNWPDYCQPQLGRGTGSIRGLTTKRRGRPPGSKNHSAPTNQPVLGMMQKKKRGRPKKKQEENEFNPVLANFQPPGFPGNNSLPATMGSHFQTQFQRNMSDGPVVRNMNTSQMGLGVPFASSQQTSFSQLLEGSEDDLFSDFPCETPRLEQNNLRTNLFESNSGVQQGAMLGRSRFPEEMNSNLGMNFSSNSAINRQFYVNPQGNRTFQTGESFVQENPLVPPVPNISVPYKTPDKFSASFEQTQFQTSQNFQSQQLQNDFHQSQQPQVTQPFSAEQSHLEQSQQDQESSLSLCEAMQISEPDADFNPVAAAPDSDLSEFLREYESYDQGSKPDESSQHELKNIQPEESFNSVNVDSFMGRFSRQNQDQLPEEVRREKERDVETIMQLIRYKQRSLSPAKSCPAYSFRFKVPTPVYKRLKCRVRSLSDDSENNDIHFVRMHPKDARKYSLLKIGREVVQLQQISDEREEKIKERLKAGEEVEAVPPAIRKVEVADIPQSVSLIADLLSAESPPSIEMIESSKVKDALSDSIPPELAEVDDKFFMMKTSEKHVVKDKKSNSMFRGRNIANIPHLKKYRAGFPYFGKGNVGRGGPLKMRPNKKGLEAEYEDDNDVVLKDVSLTEASDGTLTPLKSRTPVAGRSPAYSGTGTVSDMESKTLESKLKGLEYDLDLNQSGNAQMFQDVLLGDKELQQKQEFGNSEDFSTKPESEQKMFEGSEQTEMNGVGFDSVDLLSPTGSVILSDVEYGENSSGEIMRLEPEMDLDPKEKTDVDNLKENVSDEVKPEYKVSEKVNAEDFGSVKDSVENGYVRSLNNPRRNSRSDSRDSVSRSNSRRHSVTVTGEEEGGSDSLGWYKRRLSSDGSDSSKSDLKRVKRSNGSCSGSSRKSSRSSSLDLETGKKKKKKARKCDYRHDSDSDGIPGVDYIVVNRFKGRKELRVVVDKLRVSKEVLQTLRDSDSKLNGISSHVKMEEDPPVDIKREEGGQVEPKNAHGFSGFSAEFEKFLANHSCQKSPNQDDEIEDADSRDSVDGKTGLADDSKTSPEISVEFQKCRERDLSNCDCESGHRKSCERGSKNETAEKERNSPASVERDGVVSEATESNRRPAENMEGVVDFSSSSDDEDDNKNNRRRLEKPKPASNVDSKKKKLAKSIHDGSVFCSKVRRKKPKSWKRPSKLMCTLSVLHDATLEKLTSAQSFSDLEGGNSSSNQSSSRSRDVSDIDSPVKRPPRTKTPDFELYCDKTDDHTSVFEDTMYKLAYLSPISSPTSSYSPPRPVSPKDARIQDPACELQNVKLVETKEEKMTVADILKKMQSESELAKDTEKFNVETPSKIAVARTETLTFKDIQSFCLAEKDTEAKQKEQDKEKGVSVEETSDCVNKKFEISHLMNEKAVESPPPDLGPPVLETQGLCSLEVNSPPPCLSPNRSEIMSDLCIGRDPFRIERGPNAPPFLTPCRSPRVIQSPRGHVSPRGSRAPDGTETGDYFSLPVERDAAKPGRSPGASSSTGSINVIHSEEFSDISDEEDSDGGTTCSKRKQPKLQKPKYANSPTMQSLSSKHMECKIGARRQVILDDCERKKREVREFEEKLRKRDEKMNKSPCFSKGSNIFEMFETKSQISLNHSQGIKPHSFDSGHTSFTSSGNECFNGSFGRRFSSDNSTISHDFVSRTYPEKSPKILEGMFQPGSAARFLQNISQSRQQKTSPQNGEHVNFRHGRPGLPVEFCGSTHNEFMTYIPRLKRPMNMELGKSIEESSVLSSPPGLNQHCDSRRNNMCQQSGDLFDSFTNSSVSSTRLLHSFQRSLSDSCHPEYNIVPNNKLNTSIVRSLQNIANRDISRQSYDMSNVPMYEFGSGGGKKGQKTNRRSSQNQGTYSQGDQQNSQSFSNRSPGHSQSSDGSQGHSGQGQSSAVPVSGYHGCHVITPHSGPPSLESILATARQHDLGTYRPTGAYYSNCGDMPDKPREGGGHVIKLPSTLVKDLEEFETSSSSSLSLSSPVISGIKKWRNILSSIDPLCSTQTGSETLLDKLEKEPGLKYALTGDQSVVITPCALPPCRRAVQKWNEGRKVYKDLKNKAVQKQLKEKEVSDNTRVNVNDKPDINVQKKSEEKEMQKETAVERELELAKYRLNLFTGKRELASESEFTAVTEKSSAQTKRTESVKQDRSQLDNKEKETQDNTEGAVNVASAQESPVSSQDKSLLHSTPVLRRGSTELFETECTPISEERAGSGSQEDKETEFVTPKRLRPLRRLSTNTDTTLRRAILTSQMKQQFGTPALHRADTSQIEGPSLKNSFGFKHSQQNVQDAKALHEYQYLTVISIEVHVETRGDLRPDPEVDSIQAVFYSVLNDVPPEKGTRQETGAIIVDPVSASQKDSYKSSASQKGYHRAVSVEPQPGTSKAGEDEVLPSSSSGPGKVPETLLQKSGVPGLHVTYVRDEKELLDTFIEFVQRWDPDILVGYEIQMLSWGYILDRASVLSVNLAQAISRVPTSKGTSHHSKEQDEYGADHMSEIHIAGRIVLNLWRLLRHEVTLNVYSFENVAFHVLHRRIPHFAFRSLTAWFKHRTHIHRWKVVEYYVTRAKANLEIIDQLDIVGRTSEFARVFGIEFYHVLSRGSQYRVESMMLRVAKPMNYIPVSPSVHQRARMKAPECIPLTLEPESKFYTDPVLVLDFQSLYPSIMIGYNYCFTTCLGRIEWFQKAHEGPIEFGCTSLGLPPSVIRKLSDLVTVSPNGVVFCKSSVKRGVIPIMVEEILNTRLMVKKAMSSYKDDKTLSRMLNARQLGLKLIANVTYGYTGANFSGRMPCIEVGDSIVRKARETLERSIKLVEDTPRWGAKVIYGDTDSMFILLKGRSKDEAFKIGHDIAKTVTAMFPKPVKLKFEKVYLPCILQTKKRYVGFMYETPDQKEPVYDAKGIETVRRDTCSAVAKMLERSIKVLFTGKDVSQVKSYIQQQCLKVMEGTVSLQDFIFAKEYRGMAGYKPGACVPALEIAKKHLRQDKRSEPRVGERVPYVIVYGSPGLPLIQLVREPQELLQDPSLRLNSTYYITKQILPPLDRFLSLMGASVFSWYQEMPRPAGLVQSHAVGPENVRKGTISQYFATSNCPTCDRQTKRAVCERCMTDPQMVCVTLNERISHWERVQQKLYQICASCIGTPDSGTIKACVTLDCPVQFRRARANNDLNKADSYREIFSKVFK